MAEEEAGRHITQHFEMLGSRAIYHDGWKAVAFHPVGPLYDDGLKVNAPFDEDVWELYHVAEDHSEVHDRATEYPEKVAEMVERWWDEERRNDVLPLDNRVLEAIAHPKPDHRRPRDTFRYFPAGAQVPEPVAVNVRNRSHAITVTLEVPEGVVPNGALLALGSRSGRLVAPPARRAPALRPQPVRQDAATWCTPTTPSDPGATRRVRLREGRRPRRPAQLLYGGESWPKG